MDKYYFDVKLACRFYQDPGDWENILSILSSNGWTRVGRGAVKDGLEIEFTAETMDRLEILLSLKSKKGFPNTELFKNLLECLLTNCWYVDVYFCLRNVDVEEVSKELGLGVKYNEVKKVKIEGFEIFFEVYPSMSKIVVSYRVGIRDIGRIEKIHSKLFRRILSGKGIKVE